MKDQDNSRYGFVYVLGNYSMPGVYKIGATTRAPSQRCNELSASTSCPEPFSLLMYAEVEMPFDVEKEIHRLFSKQRVIENREFFKLDIEGINKLEKELSLSSLTMCYSELHPFIRCMHSDQDESIRMFIESGYSDIFVQNKYSYGI